MPVSDYTIEVKRRENYLHVIVTGENSRETVENYMAEVRKECESQDCFRLLIEERLEGPRLPVMDIFSIVSEGAMSALGVFEAIAYLDEKMGDTAEFAETVAINRGMPLAVFDTVDAARDWLLAQTSGPGEQRISTGKPAAD